MGNIISYFFPQPAPDSIEQAEEAAQDSSIAVPEDVVSSRDAPKLVIENECEEAVSVTEETALPTEAQIAVSPSPPTPEPINILAPEPVRALITELDGDSSPGPQEPVEIPTSDLKEPMKSQIPEPERILSEESVKAPTPPSTPEPERVLAEELVKALTTELERPPTPEPMKIPTLELEKVSIEDPVKTQILEPERILAKASVKAPTPPSTPEPERIFAEDLLKALTTELERPLTPELVINQTLDLEQVLTLEPVKAPTSDPERAHKSEPVKASSSEPEKCITQNPTPESEGALNPDPMKSFEMKSANTPETLKATDPEPDRVLTPESVKTSELPKDLITALSDVFTLEPVVLTEPLSVIEECDPTLEILKDVTSDVELIDFSEEDTEEMSQELNVGDLG